MTFFADYVEILSEFGKKVGISDVVFDQDGYCCLGFDDVVLNIEHDETLRHLLVFSEVTSLPAQPQKSLLLLLLKLNYASLVMSTGGIGIDEHAGRIMFVERIPLRGLDGAAFEAAMSSIVDRVEALKTAMSDPDFVSPNTTLNASDLPSNFPLHQC